MNALLATDADILLDAETRAQSATMFEAEYGRVTHRTDRMFVWVMLAQWALAVGLSVLVSPKTWSGPQSETHTHVYAAMYLGGVLTLFPVWMVRRAPGGRATRFVIATAQMLWSALLIHLTGGRIETHFHIFGSLAMIAFYRDLAILIPATAIVVVDHFVRGLLWPESIYGVGNPAWWRFLEHAGWVVFIDVFLIMNCKQSRDELWTLCVREVLTVRATVHAADAREVAARAEERERASQEREGAQKLEAIGQLAAGIAHEINTPIQYIGDNTEFIRRAFDRLLPALQSSRALVTKHREGTLQDEDVEELEHLMKKAKIDYLCGEIPQSIEQSMDGLRRVTSIVTAMKDFSHPSEGQRVQIDLGACIETTLTVARNEWKYVADVETSFDPELPLVPALRDELNQVFLNLIVNAAHAIADTSTNGDKGHIRITTRRRGDYAQIEVSDTGGGIPDEIRERIFEPFFTTKEVGRGTGQGLSIVHTVVTKKHHGSIEVHSEVGVGSSFIVRLPLDAEDEGVGCAA